MANYNSVRTAESQPIGSTVPWVGALTRIPPGWLVCDGQELLASDYPLLARVIQTGYGGNISGDFPNYDGVFNLPDPDQKTLADISTEYFRNDGEITPGDDQPTYNVDNPESLAVVGQYMGPSGNVGAPGTISAITDLNFFYVPDPDGTLERIQNITGTAVTVSIPVLYTNLTVEPDPAQVPQTTGIEATVNVIQNTNNTYQVTVNNKGEGYEIGDLLKISGSLVGGVDGVNDVFFEVSQVGNPFYTGTITGSGDTDLSFIPGFDIRSIGVVPRKLGREHFPGHPHPGQYETNDTGDSGSQAGRGVGVFENPEIIIEELWSGLNPRVNFITGARQYDGTDSVDIGNVWGDSRDTAEVEVLCPFETGPGRYTIGSVAGTPPARTHTALFTGSAGHGIGKPWFTSAKKLRDRSNATTPSDTLLEQLRTTGKFELNTTMPFSDIQTAVQRINYDDGTPAGLGSDNIVPFTKVLFNHAGNSFTQIDRVATVINDIVEPHDHQGEFSIEFDNGNLTIPGSLQADVVPNVIPDSLPSAFQITFNTNTPSLSILTLIRAY